MMSSPIVFSPVYQQRVWGGRNLEYRYGRPLPDDGSPYGEAWEISDRVEGESVVASGKYEGKSLTELWTNHRREVFGRAGEASQSEVFPLLVKVLDCQDDLSIQVHPPASIAGELGGEPKSEMWYVADREPGAKLYVGCRDGVSEEDFRKAIEAGENLEDYVGVLEPEPGDFIYIPSGRLHAIGAGLLIYEIQQNSDTTYRVYDWGRKGLDGNPRDLHVEESLRSIDFEDEAPEFGCAVGDRLVECDYFVVERWSIEGPGSRPVAHPAEAVILSVVAGVVECGGEIFREGDFFLVPACAKGSDRVLKSELGVTLLATLLPAAG